MHKVFFTILWMHIFVLNLSAQDTRFEYRDTSLLTEQQDTETFTDGETEVERDILSDTTISISALTISDDSINAWKQNRKFAYINKLDSLLEQKNREELNEYNKSQNSKPNRFLQMLFSSGILQMLFWLVAIAFVLIILYRLFLSNGIFKKNGRAVSVQEMAEEERMISIADHDRLIQQALMAGDHRLAVRWLFLKTLTRLSEKEELIYAGDKTNFQYVQEISADKKNEFSSLVLSYEYIWYGGFLLNAESYASVENKFNQFFHKLNG